MSDNTAAPQGAAANPVQTNQRFTVHSQYIKDLSFENPNAPGIYQELKSNPELKFGIDVGVRQFQNKLFEVIIKVNVDSKLNDKQIFLIDLEYAGLTAVAENVQEAEMGDLLTVDVPSLMFPFVRALVANLTRDGSFPPLLVNQVDFKELAKRKREAAAAQGDKGDKGGEAAPAAPAADS